MLLGHLFHCPLVDAQTTAQPLSDQHQSELYETDQVPHHNFRIQSLLLLLLNYLAQTLVLGACCPTSGETLLANRSLLDLVSLALPSITNEFSDLVRTILPKRAALGLKQPSSWYAMLQSSKPTRESLDLLTLVCFLSEGLDEKRPRIPRPVEALVISTRAWNSMVRTAHSKQAIPIHEDTSLLIACTRY